jgi:MFS family permease
MEAYNSGPAGPGGPAQDERPIGELVKQAVEQAQTLVRDEVRLAQLELQEKGKRFGLGAGMFGTAGVVALYGLGALIAAVVLLIATALEPWIAAAIVAGALFVVAGVLALVGKKEIEQATPAVPEEAKASVQRDVEEVKWRVKS